MTAQITRVARDVMNVNAFLVYGPRGITLVDEMLTASDTREMRTVLDTSAAEPAGVVITHPHPDHYAGRAHIVGDQ